MTSREAAQVLWRYYGQFDRPEIDLTGDEQTKEMIKWLKNIINE